MPRAPHLVALFIWSLLMPPLYAQTAGNPQQLSLDEAVRTAFQRSPQLRARRAEVHEAEGRLIGAQSLPFNPTVDVEAAHRGSPEGTGTDFTIGVTQEFEVAGQRSSRVDAARAEQKAAEAQFKQAQRLLAAEVSLAFFEALRAREILEISRQDKDLADTLLGAARRRLEAGSSNQLELNLATAEMGRSEERFFLAQGAYGEARAGLAEVTALDPGAPPEPAGELVESTTLALPPLAELLQSALVNRGDLEALRLTEHAVQARLKLARREAIPNLAVSGFYGREGGGDSLVGGGLSLAVPVFNRNRGAIVEARASGQRASAERAVLELQVQREVAAAYARFQAATASMGRLRETVLGTLEENLQLLRKAYEAGKTSSTEVVVIRRTFIEARRELVDAAIMARRDRVTLDLAAGRLSPPENASQDGK